MRVILLWFSLTCLLVAEPSRPNILFILADDLAWSDLACQGHPYHRTPHLDRLAEQGMRLTQAYSPAPICSASRAAILTGKAPSRLHFEFVTKSEPGRQDFGDLPLQSPPFTLDLSLEEETIGEALAAVGYKTGFFGKWHVSQHHGGYLGWSPTHGPHQQGFEEGEPDFGSHPYAYRSEKGLRDTPVKEGVFPRDTLIDAAGRFLEQSSEGESPFFLYLSLYYVHDPVHTRCAWLRDDYRKAMPEGSPDIRADYGAMVETMDHLVGRILEALESSGQAENTLVVFTGDNGGHPNYTTNAPFRGSKWNLYEGGIRVPMMVRWPGKVPEGSTNNEVVHGCDLFPTFCAVAGVEESESVLDGQDLSGLFEQRATSLERKHPLIWHFPYYHPERRFEECPEAIGVGDFQTSQTRPHSAIRKGPWKLIWFQEDNRVELYNLEEDLSEQRNLADKRPELADELRGELERTLREEHQARFAQ